MKMSDFIQCFIEYGIIVYFFNTYFQRKAKYSIFCLAIWVFTLTCFFLFLNMYVGYEKYYLLIVIILGILPILIILYYGKALEKILVSVFVLEILAIITIVVANLLSLLLYQKLDIERMVEDNFMLVFVVRNILFLLTSRSIAQLRNRIQGELPNHVLYRFLLLAIFSIFVILALESLLYTQRFDVIDGMILVVGVFMVIVSMIAIFFSTLQFAQDRMHHKLHLQANRYQEELSQKILEDEYRLRRTKHDLRHFLSALSFYIENNDKEKSKEMMKTYADFCLESEVAVISDNAFVNYLLNYKFAEAKKKNVCIRYQVAQAYSYKISDIELSILFGNAVDNAVENTVDGVVEVIVEELGGYLHIVVNNRVCEDILEHNPSLFTTKGEDHGFGLGSLRSIISRNNGSIKIIQKGSAFSVSMLVE
ncbi:MAG: sensor histidine kinase [Breznakia sp.]